MLALIPIAFISGVLTVFSPCVLPILPIVLASGIDGNKRRVNGLILGLIVSFSFAALFLAIIVKALGISVDVLRNAAALMLVLLGVSLVFPIWDKLQVHFERWFSKPITSEGTGFKGGFVTGVGLGIVWTPCVGPIVAAISTLVVLNGLSLSAIALVLAYAVGLGVPLWLIATKGGEFTGKLSVFKSNPVLIRRVFGIILILTAVFVYFGYERRLQTWFLDNLPEQWANLATTVETSLDAEDRLSGEREKQQLKKEKFDGAKVDQDEIVQGCLGGMDCIPSIDDPKFESATEGDKWLEDEDVIFGLNHNGVVRAYPQRIMNWHEIVNDELGGDHIAVTFCPLCGTGASFVREVNDEVVEFGVSGKLHNNDLIMYDRTPEENYWQQATGEAIVGPAARRDETLEWIATTTTSWERWLKKFPETEVLSRDTGSKRDYDVYPYNSYEEDETLLFGVSEEDNRFHRKAVTYGIRLDDGVAKAYLLDDLQEAIPVNGEIEDIVNGTTVLIVRRSDAEEYTFVNKETGEEIIPLRGFWFAWFAFNPNTEVFEIN